MSRFDHHWQKLTSLARQAPPEAGDLSSPPGFATRVAARAAAAPAASPWAVLERLALRGLLVAAACGLAAVALNYSSFTSEPAVDYTATDTVSDLLDFS